MESNYKLTIFQIIDLLIEQMRNFIKNYYKIARIAQEIIDHRVYYLEVYEEEFYRGIICTYLKIVCK